MYIYIGCLQVIESKQISKLVGLTSFQRLNGVIKYSDLEYDIFKSYSEARRAEHERTKAAKRSL